MRANHIFCSVAALFALAQASPERVFQKLADANVAYKAAAAAAATATKPASAAPISTTSPYLNKNSEKFVVKRTGFPRTSFDIGESYAGLLPVSSNKNETRKLFFWFFPSQNPLAKKEIAAWFNGGPGCSSLSGLLTENGPFLFQSGTKEPVQNPYAWNKLTNYVWIEQPVGVGYSEGEPNISNEIELGEQFAGFWKNFVDTFELKGRKTYLTGESYAGFYVPYIANQFLKENDKDYFNLGGIAINDPIIGNEILQTELPIPSYASYWQKVLYNNQTDINTIQATADACGYTAYSDKYFRFPPPKTPWAEPPNYCGVFNDLYYAATLVNPCFNIYHILDTCPFVYSHLGIVNQGDYSPPHAQVYFNRADVKKALNVPDAATWYQCTPKNVFDDAEGDRSPGPALDGTLKNVIEKTNNVIVGSGALDALLPTNGTLFALQNLTWNGGQGFQKYPSTPFYVPIHNEPEGGAQAGAGTVGVWRKERGVTFYEIHLAGHEVPGYSLGGGYRSIELLLGRIPSLSAITPFSGGAPL